MVADVLLRESLEEDGVRRVPFIVDGGVVGARFGGLAATETAPSARAIAKKKERTRTGTRSVRVRQCLVSLGADRQPPKAQQV